MKSNCSLQSYVPAVHPLMDLGVTKVLACTYQAISGAGKTFERWPEILDNVIPYIGGEEEKSEQEPLKIWGHVENGVIVNATAPAITAQCLRVPVSDGHMAAVFVSFDQQSFHGGDHPPLGILPRPRAGTEPAQRAQTVPALLHRAGSAANEAGSRCWNTAWRYRSVGCVPTRSTTIKFVCLSHNTLRGAAGGGVLMAELLCAEGYMD